LLPGAAEPPEQVWRNPGGSVHLRSHRCGDKLCGTVVWASDKAIADARRGGTESLVGTRIFRDFHLVRDGVWRGRVFVPDIRRTFSGTITFVDADHMIGRGCLLPGLGCRSQTWTRLPQ
jgi:uncharacterized protein (DUF2147 family)